MWLMHHGIKGMHWGIKMGPPYPLDGPSKMLQNMNEFRYTEFSTLKSADEVSRTKSGSCHDQVMYELQQLRKMGLKPKAKFMISIDHKTGQGYETHSFVYYNQNDGKCVWIENSWENNKGKHIYANETSMMNDIKRRSHIPKGTTLEFGDFDDSVVKPGDTLQDLVNKCL